MSVGRGAGEHWSRSKRRPNASPIPFWVMVRSGAFEGDGGAHGGVLSSGRWVALRGFGCGAGGLGLVVTDRFPPPPGREDHGALSGWSANSRSNQGADQKASGGHLRTLRRIGRGRRAPRPQDCRSRRSQMTTIRLVTSHGETAVGSDRSSVNPGPESPRTSPRRTPTRTERRIIKVRVLRRWGPARIAGLLRLAPSTDRS
jgi:hypothetical protein